jgi:predicted  nucleic acid-binding Zn-ribbon protein
MNTNQEKKNNKTIWIGLLAALLLGSNAYWLFNNSGKNDQITAVTAKADETEELRAKLEKEYYESLSQLEEMKGQNTELNKVIDAQKAQLSQQKAKIDDLIRNKKDLASARSQIDGLKTQLNQYLAEIQTLKTDNTKLSAKVKEVEEQAATLTTNVATLTEEKTNLNTQLNSTTKDLEDTKAREDNLKKVIKVDKVELIPINAKGSEVSKAKKADGFKVVFKTSKNTFARGKEMFYVQVISPQGVTIGNKAMKVKLNNDEEVAFTTSSEVSYNGAEQDVTTTILLDDNKFEPRAQYEVRIYHRGEYVGGNTSKKLKKNMFG